MDQSSLPSPRAKNGKKSKESFKELNLGPSQTGNVRAGRESPESGSLYSDYESGQQYEDKVGWVATWLTFLRKYDATSKRPLSDLIALFRIFPADTTPGSSMTQCPLDTCQERRMSCQRPVSLSWSQRWPAWRRSLALCAVRTSSHSLTPRCFYWVLLGAVMS